MQNGRTKCPAASVFTFYIRILFPTKVVKRIHFCKSANAAGRPCTETPAATTGATCKLPAVPHNVPDYSTLVRYMLRNSIGPPSLCRAIYPFLYSDVASF